MPELFDGFDLHGLKLKNRIVMPPMTRSRAKLNKPDHHTARYYTQRASAGLIITEGTVVSARGRGYLWTPGIYTDDQEAAWRQVADAVHQAGGRIFMQLWHVGRMSHVTLQEDGGSPVSSVASLVGPEWPVFAFNEQGEPDQIPASPARALAIPEIHSITDEFVMAAERAIRAGFDGVEFHAGGTYLFDQFINGAINTRTDRYGGQPVGNRLRFLLETVDAVSAKIGSEKLGLRISPENRLKGGLPYSDETETFTALATALNSRNIAYLHLSDHGISPGMFQAIRAAWQGVLISSGGLTREKAEALIKAGQIDLAGFGKAYIANPDLAERFRNNWPLATADRAIFYGGDETGYTDFSPYKET